MPGGALHVLSDCHGTAAPLEPMATSSVFLPGYCGAGVAGAARRVGHGCGAHTPAAMPASFDDQPETAPLEDANKKFVDDELQKITKMNHEKFTTLENTIEERFKKLEERLTEKAKSATVTGPAEEEGGAKGSATTAASAVSATTASTRTPPAAQAPRIIVPLPPIKSGETAIVQLTGPQGQGPSALGSAEEVQRLVQNMDKIQRRLAGLPDRDGLNPPQVFDPAEGGGEPGTTNRQAIAAMMQQLGKVQEILRKTAKGDLAPAKSRQSSLFLAMPPAIVPVMTSGAAFI